MIKKIRICFIQGYIKLYFQTTTDELQLKKIYIENNEKQQASDE